MRNPLGAISGVWGGHHSVAIIIITEVVIVAIIILSMAPDSCAVTQPSTRGQPRAHGLLPAFKVLQGLQRHCVTLSASSQPRCKDWHCPSLQLRKWRPREVRVTQGEQIKARQELDGPTFHHMALPLGLVDKVEMLFRFACVFPDPTPQASPHPCPPSSCSSPLHLP